MLDDVPYRRPARIAALPLSLVVHALVVALFLVGSSIAARFEKPKVKKPSVRPVSVRKISAKEWAQARAVPPPKGQIVDVAPGNRQRPEESKFLAETDNTVKKETRAKEQTLKYSRATPKNQPNPEAAPAVKGNLGGRSAPPVTAQETLERFGGGQPKRLTQLMQEAAKGREQNLDADEKAGAEDGEAAPAVASDAAEPGGGAPADKLDVPEGEGTYLNTREWKYAAFFNRVKQSVSARWDPMRKLKEKDPQARQLQYRDRTTVLGVSLRPDGSIADIYVAESSGVEALDIESVQAFERAAPFSNPPAALVQNGLIRFAFSFNVMNR